MPGTTMSAADAQNDFPTESHRHFLLKLDANDCLSGKPQPQTASDWEGAYFQSDKPRATRHREALPPDQRKDPVPGDELLIWINMQTGGSGLTATARVSSCERRDTKLLIRVENVVLFLEPRIDDATLRLGEKSRRRDDALEDINSSRISKLRYLSPLGWEEINARAESNSGKLIQQGAEEEISRRERLGRISSRPAQVEFSVRLRRAYNAKCAVTGCTTPEALEAAHIRVNEPQEVRDAMTSRSDDNSLENGILLRADIHALFDKGLVTLSEDGTKIQVSAILTDKTYASLENAPVFRPPHSPPSRLNIASHRRRFCFPC
jgi:HNH endonuclease